MSDPKPSSDQSYGHGDAVPGAWERNVLERLVRDVVAERRRARRWSIFFRLSLLALALLLIGGVYLDQRGGEPTGPHTALVELNGEISATSNASADNVIDALQDAFDDPQSRAVILRINSPGGSPVQAGRINQEIWRLRALHKDVPIYAVCDEACASAAYYIASAADRIYVDPASLVGSIGVLMNGFDFSGLMQKLGISRRLLTAGANKDFMDPFTPMTPQQKDYALEMLSEIHRQFIQAVEKGRGKRLKVDDQTFSGLVWTGEAAVKQGLADGFGSTESVARDVVHVEHLVDYTRHENVVDRLAQRFGAAAGDSAAHTLLQGSWSLR